MSLQCPHCKAPLSTARRIFGSYLWAKWTCSRCGSILAFHKLYRILIGLGFGLVIALCGTFLASSLSIESLILLGVLACPLIFVAWSFLGVVIVIKRHGTYCQECGYDLAGNEPGRCPECGTNTPGDLNGG